MNRFQYTPAALDTNERAHVDPLRDIAGVLRLWVDVANNWTAGDLHLFMKCRAAPTSAAYTGEYIWARQLTGHSVDDEVFITRSAIPVGDRQGKLVYAMEAFYPRAHGKITSADAEGGVYLGSLWKPPTAPIAVAGTFAESKLGSAGAAIRIYNASERGTANHDLANADAWNKIFPLSYLGPSDDGLPAFMISREHWKDCP